MRVDKLVSFIQHDLPGLKSGKYKLKVSQSVQDKGKAVFDKPIMAEYDIAVGGDRFSFFNPSTAIYSVFPAANATGRYDTVLPSVVFPKTSLPWSRSPLNDKASLELKQLLNNKEDDIPTWLTVLLLDEEDLITYKKEYPGFTLETQVRTVNDLFPATIRQGSTLGDNYSYFNRMGQSGKPAADSLDVGEQFTDAVQTIDIPLPLFFNIAPSVEDLKYMAHIRKVSLVNKPTLPGISDIGEPEGSFSIVFGNRLPGSNRKTSAYLVSLESMEDFLPSLSFKPDAKKMVRLAVLKSWSFYSTGDNASFVDRLKRLNGAEKTESVVNADLSLTTCLQLRAPQGSIQPVKDALSMGYVPLKHHLRSVNKTDNSWQGEKTVSWYRSPLCPYRVDGSRIQPPLVSADKATIYDPTTGMFDVSYASAWTLGRQLALQDKSFATKLYNWKRQLNQKIKNKVEVEHLENILGLASDELRGEISENSGDFMKRAISSLLRKE